MPGDIKYKSFAVSLKLGACVSYKSKKIEQPETSSFLFLSNKRNPPPFHSRNRVNFYESSGLIIPRPFTNRCGLSQGMYIKNLITLFTLNCNYRTDRQKDSKKIYV